MIMTVATRRGCVVATTATIKNIASRTRGYDQTFGRNVIAHGRHGAEPNIVRVVFSRLSSTRAVLENEVDSSGVKRRRPCRFFSSNQGNNHATKGGGGSNSTNIHVTAGGVLILVVGATLGGRWLYDQMLGGASQGAAANTKIDPYRLDASRATVLLQTAAATSDQPKASQANLSSSGKTADGVSLQKVDRAEFEAFLAQQRAILTRARKQSEQVAAQVLSTELKRALADADDRVADFADWYLGYPTTYKLLGLAMSSATQYAVTFRNNKDQETLASKVAQDLQVHVCRKYEALVLRPAVTHPKIHRAFVTSLRRAHEEYLQAVAELETSVSDFVSNQARSYYASPPSSNDVVVNVDWSAQLAKVQHVPLAYEKTPELTVGLVTAGAAAGKIAGTASLGAAVKALGAKLSAPFATKAAGTVMAGKAAAGATAGAAAGGALGATVGAAVGIGVDVAVNAGVALMQRSALEQDVRESLDATLMEWEERLRPELDRAQSVWFGHAEDLLRVDTTPSDSAKPNNNKNSNNSPTDSSNA